MSAPGEGIPGMGRVQQYTLRELLQVIGHKVDPIPRGLQTLFVPGLPACLRSVHPSQEATSTPQYLNPQLVAPIPSG